MLREDILFRFVQHGEFLVAIPILQLAEPGSFLAGSGASLTFAALSGFPRLEQNRSCVPSPATTRPGACCRLRASPHPHSGRGSVPRESQRRFWSVCLVRAHLLPCYDPQRARKPGPGLRERRASSAMLGRNARAVASCTALGIMRTVSLPAPRNSCCSPAAAFLAAVHPRSLVKSPDDAPRRAEARGLSGGAAHSACTAVDAARRQACEPGAPRRR